MKFTIFMRVPDACGLNYHVMDAGARDVIEKFFGSSDVRMATIEFDTHEMTATVAPRNEGVIRYEDLPHR